MKHTISGLVKNQPGVLESVAAAFADYEVNIKSIAVSATDLFDACRMTIVVEGHDDEIVRTTKVLRKMKEIIQIDDLSSKEFVDRELALIKVSSGPDSVSQISQIAELFGARACAVGRSTVTLEIVGDESKIDGLIQMLGPLGIRAVARTGLVALPTGDDV